MRIVVTGGSGQFGQAVVRELAARKHEVLSLDRTPHPGFRPAWIVDLNQPGDLYQAMAGAEAVVHLAAIPAPNLASDTATFNNNVAATYNMFKAAADLGVKKVVVASSIAAYGYIYARGLVAPEYLPLDEAHPCRPADPYVLSKEVGDTLAESFARGMQVASLRFPGIYFDPTYRTFAERMKAPRGRAPGFFTYIDARDAAAACRLALEADWPGHEVFNVAAPNSNMREPTHELVKRYFPSLTKFKPGLEGNWSGMDSSKAERELGFRAEHLWQNYLKE